jgi:RHS repeat-associated protein
LRPVQRFHLGGREAEHEILGKAREVALDLLVEPLGGHPVERGEIRIEHHLLPADQGSTTLGDLTYGYDNAGRRTAIGGSYARTSLPPALASTTHDANNRLTAWGGVSLTYDDNGNLTGDGTNTYTWDVRNRLTAISGGVSASFAYDALGRRTTRTVSGTTVKYLHDGLNVVQRQDASGTPTAQMLMGGLDEIFGEITGSGTTSYFADALGSSVALSDGSGTTTAEFTYEPYGKNSKTGSGDTPFRYTARDDDGTRLYYYRARYYHPGLGRFISEDPIGLAGGLNLYAYVGGNPLSYVDPLGLRWEYRQSTGEMAYVNDSTEARTIIVQGNAGAYSGQGPGVNNPAYQAVQDVGPIPQGAYIIGPAYTHPNLGPVTMNLYPANSFQMFGRSRFRIHGDNSAQNQTASEGCIVLPRAAREQMGNSPDKELWVLP